MSLTGLCSPPVMSSGVKSSEQLENTAIEGTAESRLHGRLLANEPRKLNARLSAAREQTAYRIDIKIGELA